MYFNGYIYRGLKSLFIGVLIVRQLAEIEIEYKDHESLSLYVKFNVVDAKDYLMKKIHL